MQLMRYIDSGQSCIAPVAPASRGPLRDRSPPHSFPAEDSGPPCSSLHECACVRSA